MKFLSSLCAVWLLTAPAFAQGVARHQIKLTINPDRGTIDVDDEIQMDGGGKTTLLLSRLFRVKKLVINDRPHSPLRTDNGLLIDLGTAGHHKIHIITHATFKASKTPLQPPFLNAEGGLILQDWIAQPENKLSTWNIEGVSPLSQKWLTPGKLVFETKQNQKYFARFENQTPGQIPVLITGPFDITERMANGIRIRTYFHKELTPLADRYLTDSARYIQDDVKKIGAFPYSAFSIVSATMPVGFGLPGITYMGRRVLALPFIRTTSLPHEVLHNWWGNAVDVDYNLGNWAEGLTTYQSDLAQSALKNNDGGTSKRVEWLRNYAALSPAQDLALDQFTSTTHDASQIIGYGKSAFVFHMLDTKLGHKIFNTSLQHFYKAHRFQTASWADLQASFEAVSKQDLAPFFKAWLTRPGAPMLKLNEASTKSKVLSFDLEQIQNGPVYPLDIPILVTTKSGTQTVLVHMTQRTQTFQITAKNMVTALTVDPSMDVFRRLSTSDTPPIFRDILLNTTTKLVAPKRNAKFKALVQTFADQLLQRPVSMVYSVLKSGPQIIIGLESDIPAAFTKDVPSKLNITADGRAYTVRRNGQDTLVITAKDPATLSDMAQVLAHYKRRSYVIFKGGKVIKKGTWPASHKSLSRKF